MMKGTTAEKILLEYDPELKNLLPVLKKISSTFGYVSEKDAEKVADYFTVPEAKVYETASFYDQINVRKQPGLVIQICSGMNCAVGSSFELVRVIEKMFGIKADDESSPKIKLEIISCLGRCGEGPIMVVNGEVFTRVTESGAVEVLEKYV